MLLGDFNVNCLDTNDSKTTQLHDFLRTINLRILINEPTHFTNNNCSFIDLVCANTDLILHDSKVTHYPELGAHALISSTFKIRKPKLVPKIIVYRPINDIDIQNFNEDLLSTHWDSILDLNDVDSMVDLFNKFVLKLFDKHAPEKSISIKEHKPPWLTSNITFMMGLRDRAHLQFRKSKLDSRREEYKTLKHLVNSSMFYEKVAYFNNHINKNLNNPTSLWKNLKKTALPDFKTSAELPDFFNDPDLINQHFLDLPNTSLPVNTVGSSLSEPSVFSLRPVQEELIAKTLFGLKSRARGIDGISLDMVIMTLPCTLRALTAIVNMSITTSTFPKLWKQALIRPLPKNNSPNDLKDLRPISILPFLSKVLEKVIYKQVEEYCQKYNIFPELQSGFRRGRGTETAVLNVVDDMLAASDSGMGSILALLDFSRAFDSINITNLLLKLRMYGFEDCTLDWFKSYLTGRYQQVIITNSRGLSRASTNLPVNRGVPQGSILGPLLFILYSADITRVITSCKFHLYADDVQIYLSFHPSRTSNAAHKINEDLDRIYKWSIQNSLSLNPSKSKFLVVGTVDQVSKILKHKPSIMINGDEVRLVAQARNLGVLMDSHLKFHDHVLELTRNCFYRLKVLYNIRPFLSTDLRIRLCESLVLSKFNHCLAVYGPCLLKKSLSLVQRIQNACARYCFSIPPRTHVTPFLNSSNMLRMEGRIKMHLAGLLFGIVKFKTPEYLYKKLTWRFSSARFLRSCALQLAIPQHRTAAFRGSFRFSATKCWNDLPPPFREFKSKFTFKKHYRQYLLQLQKI